MDIKILKITTKSIFSFIFTTVRFPKLRESNVYCQILAYYFSVTQYNEWSIIIKFGNCNWYYLILYVNKLRTHYAYTICILHIHRRMQQWANFRSTVSLPLITVCSELILGQTFQREGQRRKLYWCTKSGGNKVRC